MSKWQQLTTLRASSVEQVRRFVRNASKEQGRVAVQGYSLDAANTATHIVDLSRLHQVSFVDQRESIVSVSSSVKALGSIALVHLGACSQVEAGITIANFEETLQQHGLALRCAPFMGSWTLHEAISYGAFGECAAGILGHWPRLK